MASTRARPPRSGIADRRNARTCQKPTATDAATAAKPASHTTSKADVGDSPRVGHSVGAAGLLYVVVRAGAAAWPVSWSSTGGDISRALAEIGSATPRAG